MGARVVNVTEFKAKCLSLLDEVGARGGSLMVTKRGKPLVVVERARVRAWKSPAGLWAGKVKLPKDLDSIDLGDLWDVSKK